MLKGKYQILQAVFAPIIRTLFRVKTFDFEKLDNDERTIILPNHVSLLDGVFLYLLLPRKVVFVVSTDAAKRFAFFVKFVNHVTIDPFNPYSMKELIGLIKSNVPLVIFPEGRVSTTNGLMKIYDGAGFLALKTGAVLYPLIITGLEHSLLSGAKDKLNIKLLPQVSLFVHDPIRIFADGQEKGQIKKSALSDAILQRMQEALFKSRFREKSNLFNELLKAADTHGWKTPIIQDIKQKATYKNLVLASYILGNQFSSKLSPQEQNVGVLLPNSIAHAATLFGLFYINRTPAILNFSSGISNILDCAEVAEIKTVITSREFVEKGGFEKLVEQLGQKYSIMYLEDVKENICLTDKLGGLVRLAVRHKPGPAVHRRVILFTSGTESKPKGVILKHSSIIANVTQASAVIDIHRKDKMFNALPMFHSFGLTLGVITPFLLGVPVFLYPTPLHYKVIPELAYQHDATILLGTPGFLAGYARNSHPYDFYTIRYVFAGAEKLSDEVRALWQKKFGIRIFEGYGCTETAPVLSLNTPLSCREGTVGRLLPGIDYRVKPVEGIEDGGSLFVKGPNVMEGYLLHGRGYVPAEEWYDTGDIVAVDENGYVTIKSRLKRFAKITGEMVSLDQVESLAVKCFNPDESYAAVKLNDPVKGERIILVTTDKNCTLKQFREYLVKNDYNMLGLPAEIVRLNEIPLLGSGKTDYVSLQQLVMENIGGNLN